MGNAYEEGYQAGLARRGWGVNPYDPDSETVNHEKWLNGYGDGQKDDMEEQKDFQEHFES